MAGSSFGTIFRITTWGESHGPAIGAVVDGCPAGLPLSEDDFTPFMERRRPNAGPMSTARREGDRVQILSGVFEGMTTGTPISLLIQNADQHSADYSAIASVFRPGHADFGFRTKYGVRDYRGGGRSSGRETAARVAGGAIASKILREAGITYKVCKNTMMNFAFKGTEFEPLCAHLHGANAIAISKDDATAPSRIIKKHFKANPTIRLVGGIIEGKFYDDKQVEALADVPTREVLLGRLFGSMQSPVANFARVIKQIAEKDPAAAEAAAPAEEAAPAAE